MHVMRGQEMRALEFDNGTEACCVGASQDALAWGFISLGHHAIKKTNCHECWLESMRCMPALMIL